MGKTVEYLSGNLAILTDRWPNVGRRVAEAGLPPKVAVDDSGPQATLVINGLHLSSGYDRGQEALLQAALIPAESEEAWVYGFGLGDLPRALLGRAVLKRLTVVVLNSEVARASCHCFDHCDWLQDPRVNLVLYEQERDVRFPFAAVPPCLQLAEEKAARLRDLVFLALATPFIRSKQAERFELHRNRLNENETLVASDGDVATLFGQFPGRTLAVAGAGPTLSSHYEYLREHRGSFCLVAVDAALRPLAAAGISPDVVVSIEGNEEGLLPFFSAVDLDSFEESALVYFPIVPGSVLTIWPGRRLTAYPDQPQYAELSARYPKGRLFSSGSVIHPAVDLAVKMGAAKVLLLGADFSFPGEKSHVEGCQALDSVSGLSSRDWVLSGRGERVKTLPNLRGYLRDLETYIAANPHVAFVNGSRDGAKIEGTEYLGTER